MELFSIRIQRTFQLVSTVLFLARLICSPFRKPMKSLLPVMTANLRPPICSKIVFAIIVYI